MFMVLLIFRVLGMFVESASQALSNEMSIYPASLVSSIYNKLS